MRNRRQLFTAFLLALALDTGCLGQLDTVERVHDLRMLALRADPPEQVILAAILPDGGVVPAPGSGAPPTLAPVTITGLLADPAGSGRAITCSLSTCVKPADDGRCYSDSDGYRSLGVATVSATELGAEPSFQFSPDINELVALAQADPLRGFGGIWLTVQLTVEAGSEHVVGFKRVVFTPALSPPYPAPNRLPALSGVQFNGASWDPATPVRFGDLNTITPLPDQNLVETYQRPLFAGGNIQFKEAWRYNYFATLGTFSSASTGGTNNLTGTGAPIETKWQPVPGDAEGPLTVFIVVRDGRGGETWTIRRALSPHAP